MQPATFAFFLALLRIHFTYSQFTTIEDNNASRRDTSVSTNDVAQDLQEWLDKTVEGSDKMVGVSAFLVAGKGKKDTVVTSGSAVLASAWDVRSKKGINTKPKIMTDETTIMIASVSKLLSWTALSMMMDAGKFSLDDPVSDVLPFEVKNPRFPSIKITYRHIFAHTSGFRDVWVYRYGSDCPSNPMAPYPNALFDSIKKAMSEKSNWSSKKPGSKYMYSNYGNALGALLVERHSGLPFAVFTKKFLFDPLRMTSTQWSRPSDSSAAELYNIFNKNGYKYKTWKGGYCFADWPSGQLWSTPSDLAKFGRAMLKRGNLGYKTPNGADCLYSEVTGELVYKKISPGTGQGDSALGWFVGKPYYEDGAGHDGGESGVSADFYVHLKSGVAVGFLANGELGNLYQNLMEKLLESASALGSIENDFDPDNPKDCSPTWAADATPTASPSPEKPTSSPENGSCNENSADEFLYGLKNGKEPILKTCAWLSKKANKGNICKKKVMYKYGHRPPQVVCPITCKSCDKCYENKWTKYSHSSKKNGKGIYKRCSWLKRRSKKNIEIICAKDVSYEGYPVPSDACPTTCGLAGC